MKRLGSLVVSTAVLVSCGGPAPLQFTELLNGTQGRLRFDSSANLERVAVGGTIGLTVDRIPQLGHMVVGEVWQPGALFRLDGPTGATLQQNAESIGLTFRCATAGRVELKLTVQEPGRPAFFDSIGVSCLDVAELRASLLETDSPPRFLVGGEVWGSVSPRGADGAELSGWLPIDVAEGYAASIVTGRTDNVFQLQTRSAATNVKLRAGGLTTDLALEIVDDPAWTPVVSVERKSGLPGFTDGTKIVHVDVRATDRAGAPLRGAHDCVYTARTAGSVSWRSAGTCSFDAYEFGDGRTTHPGLSDADQLCVAVMGKEACTQVAR